MKIVNTTTMPLNRFKRLLNRVISQTGIHHPGLTVMVYECAERPHGLCTPFEKKIEIWIMNVTSDDEICFLFAHELAHLTDENIQMLLKGLGNNAELHADSIAERVTGLMREELQWVRGYRGYSRLVAI